MSERISLKDKKISRREFVKLSSGATIGLAALATIPEETQSTLGLKDDEPTSPLITGNPLADPIAELQQTPVWDYLIIGSGYGGAIVAARLAERIKGQKSIAVLERGKEWIPGSFPQTLDKGLKQVRSPLNPLGLYDFHMDKEIDVFAASGLGGTSLLNAMVAITPDKELFEHERWPDEIKEDYADGKIETYFNVARKFLQVEKYPENLPLLPKAQVLKDAAEARGANFERTDLVVNFTRADGTLNIAGVPQNKCRLCGDCVSGCNFGAKNTLNLNYLPLAKRPLSGESGAKIFTQVEVDYVEKDIDGYRVWYTYHNVNGDKENTYIRSKNVVVSAGTLGSSGILLRSKVKGHLPLSENVGNHFSGNGDFLAMSYNGKIQTNVLGFGTSTAKKSEYKTGVCMEVAADYRNRPNLEDRILIENGAIPNMLVGMMRHVIEIGTFPRGKQLWRALKDFVMRTPTGALNHSMLYLANGHDDSNGKIALNDKGQTKISWPNLKKQKVFKLMETEIRAHAKLNGGSYLVPNPRFNLNRTLMTVHPLGGCAMGNDRTEAVIDHQGRAFDSSSGNTKAVLKGFYVADGSILPMGLGVNPLLTISALSERIADYMTGVRE
jgi:cholesterol oxidase